MPSGTLTVVHQLIKHWDQGSSKVILLCNRDYGNFSFLEKLRDKYGIQLDVNATLTVQDRLAKLAYERTTGLELLLRKLLIRLLSPIIVVRGILHLRRYFKSNNVDVIYSHAGGYPFSNLNVLAILAGKLAGVRNNFLISHNFSNPISLKRRPFSFVQDRMVGFAAKEVLSVSKATAESIEQERLIGRKVGYIYNGITVGSDSEGHGTAPPRWRKEGRRVIMFLGALAPRKGLDVLIRALSGVRGDWILVVYGSGTLEYENYLESLVESPDLRDKVVFAGFDPNASRLLEYSDFLVLPSVSYESFGIVILEAMRHKKAVICSDFGGMKEVVEDGVTGLVVAAGDSAKLCDAVQYLVDNPDRARQMGERGFRRLCDCFDIKSVVRRYSELVE